MQSVYIVGYGERYECSGNLRYCSTYDKAFEYLKEVVAQSDLEWNDDYFKTFDNHEHDIERGRGDKHWMYSDPSERMYYTINIRPVY